MIFFVTGASGSGKTAIIPALRQRLPHMEIRDFDEVGVPPHPDRHWRQRTTEFWIQHGLTLAQEGRHLVLSGGAIPGEIIASPSAPPPGDLAICLLDCDDAVRFERLHARGAHSLATPDMLNWASWQRAHARDPQWRLDVIQNDSLPGMHWDRWSASNDLDVWILDTTHLSIEEVAQEVVEWINT